jgi:type VII secretion-associated protein (TIGR03931 family)
VSHVVVVGPATVRGPGAVDAELISVALDCIDDELALVEDRAVPVDQVWRDVLRAAMDGPCDDVVLICPSWWASARVELVRGAARVSAEHVTVRQRVDVLAPSAAVEVGMEVAPELVVMHVADERHAVARVGAAEAVVEGLVGCLAGRDVVTVDVPSGVTQFGTEVVRGLRRRGVEVTVVGDHTVVAAAREYQQRTRNEWSTWRRLATPRAAVLAGALLAATALTVAAAVPGTESTEAPAMTWLVEGRVAVEVPAQWAVERVTTGPGSARVQVVSPTNPLSVIHVTQSRVPNEQTLDVTAAALGVALAEEPDGVFVDFTARGQRAQRPVVAYREVRADRHVSWAVLLDRGVRIAIGCQGAPDDAGPEQFCDLAVRSARAVA